MTDLSVDAAREADARGELAQWVFDFLASPGSDNADLAESLEREMGVWLGPVVLPFDRLHRLAGPPDQPTLGRLNDDDLDTVEDMADSVEDGWEPPPLIVTYRTGQLVLEDGNHRVEGLRQLGKTEYWSVVGCVDDEERAGFDRQTWS